MNIDILGLGEVVVDWVAIVDHFPVPDEKIDSIEQNLFSGGVTANYVVAASRLNARTGFIGAIGNDDQGRFIQTDFRKENVIIDYLIEKKGKNTPVDFIFVVKSSGEKVIIQSPYMYTTVPELSDFSPNWLKNVKLLHTTGIYPEITTKAFEIAKKENVKISFDLEKQIILRGSPLLKTLLKQVDILMPNKAGAMQITGTTNPMDAAKKFLDWGIKTIVITLGEEGSLVVTQKEIIKNPAMKTKVVDTTGAGDTFCAAFDYAYGLKDHNLHDASLIANAAAALKISKLGARTGMPTIKEIKNYLEQNNISISGNL